jgi:hypothetical protein
MVLKGSCCGSCSELAGGPVAAAQELTAGDAQMHYVECGQEFVREEVLGTGLDPVSPFAPLSSHPSAAHKCSCALKARL